MKGCYALLTARDTDFAFRTDGPHRTVYLQQASDGNLHDVSEFLLQHASRVGFRTFMRRNALDERGFIKNLSKRSEGNFMYLRYVLPEIEHGRYTNQDWNDLPQGLLNYYDDHWTLMREFDSPAWFRYKLPVLKMLAAAPEPVSIDLLADRFREVPRRLIRHAVEHDWRQFLEHVETVIDGVMVIGWRLYHTSFADFLKVKTADTGDPIDLAAERDAWHAYWRDHDITPD